MAAVAAVVLGLVIGIALGVILLGGSDDTSQGAETPTGGPGEATTDGGSDGSGDSGDSGGDSGGDGGSADPAGAEVPDGFRLVRDPLDFTVAVPDGWQRRLDGPTRVDFVSPEGDRFLRIDQRAQALPDAEQAWLEAESGTASALSGYERIRIEPVDFRRWEAADWEFVWESDGGTVHVLNRGVITDPRGFAIYMSGPDDTWEDESLPVFEVAAATFRPSS